MLLGWAGPVLIPELPKPLGGYKRKPHHDKMPACGKRSLRNSYSSKPKQAGPSLEDMRYVPPRESPQEGRY